MRLDVREATIAAAKGEREHNHACVALVSVQLLDEWQDWSEPVRLKAKLDPDGLISFEVRRATDVHPEPSA